MLLTQSLVCLQIRCRVALWYWGQYGQVFGRRSFLEGGRHVHAGAAMRSAGCTRVCLNVFVCKCFGCDLRMTVHFVTSTIAYIHTQTHGGYAFATDFDIERKFREARLYRVIVKRKRYFPVTHALSSMRCVQVCLRWSACVFSWLCALVHVCLFRLHQSRRI